jgi:GTP cyclohydrolase I
MKRKNTIPPTEEIVRSLLKEIGENPEREGLLKTPERVAAMYEFLMKGYNQDVKKILNGAIFDEKFKEMVIVKNIDFFSLCEHHMIPFFGQAHIAYVPNGRIVGLSKLPRIVDMFARRLQVQERMTRQIADTIFKAIAPDGVGVVVEAQHLCMMMRGVEKQHSVATTSAMLGTFREDHRTRNEFLNLIGRK